MKFLRSWFDGLVKASWDRANSRNDTEGAKLPAVRARDSYESDGGLNLQVFKAVGGKIVSFNNYDHRVDRHKRTVYIITDEQDFERELGKMITMESMKL